MVWSMQVWILIWLLNVKSQDKWFSEALIFSIHFFINNFEISSILLFIRILLGTISSSIRSHNKSRILNLAKTFFSVHLAFFWVRRVSPAFCVSTQRDANKHDMEITSENSNMILHITYFSSPVGNFVKSFWMVLKLSFGKSKNLTICVQHLHQRSKMEICCQYSDNPNQCVSVLQYL